VVSPYVYEEHIYIDSAFSNLAEAKKSAGRELVGDWTVGNTKVSTSHQNPPKGSSHIDRWGLTLRNHGETTLHFGVYATFLGLRVGELPSTLNLQRKR
jgi:hypothetical protein